MDNLFDFDRNTSLYTPIDIHLGHRLGKIVISIKYCKNEKSTIYQLHYFNSLFYQRAKSDFIIDPYVIMALNYAIGFELIEANINSKNTEFTLTQKGYELLEYIIKNNIMEKILEIAENHKNLSNTKATKEYSNED